jgi:tRNA(Arg) A34 adenosine deaminase TadA
MANRSVQLTLPSWLDEFLRSAATTYPTDTDRMGLAIELSRLNIEHRTGGPFGAAIFDESGVLVAPGINLVETSNCSLWHAEMVAIAIAQTSMGRFDLSDGGRVRLELFASCEPCAMCMGAIPWSGVTRLVCGAGQQDAMDAGFDEGAKPANWWAEFEKRGIAVQQRVMLEEAAAILRKYAATGGTIYNPKSSRL